jgi:proteasome accessory factor B
VASRRGHWYLVGHDVARGAARVFRLSRVVGAAQVYGEPGAYDVPEGVDVVGMIAEFAPRPGSSTATIRVAEGRANGLRRRATSVTPDGGSDVLEVPYSDDEAMAADVVGLGAAAVVHAPESLRSAVVRRLRLAAGEGAA